MKNKIVLSIVVSSFSGLLMSEQAMAANSIQSTVKIAPKAEKASGKCASGKCGTEKIYSQTKLSYNPQDKLVLARDGKCGTTGVGFKTTEQETTIRMAGGVCGQ